jgi:hypothetical protein
MFHSEIFLEYRNSTVSPSLRLRAFVPTAIEGVFGVSFTSDVPISALYEQNRVHHVGPFPKLEDQLCSFCVDFDRRFHGLFAR